MWAIDSRSRVRARVACSPRGGSTGYYLRNDDVSRTPNRGEPRRVTNPLLGIEVRELTDRPYRLGQEISVDVVARVSVRGRLLASARRAETETQGLRAVATAVSDWGAGAPDESETLTMMGRPVRRVRNRVGSINCRDLDGLDLRIGDQVHLTIVLTLCQVGCDRLADDGSVERLQVWSAQAALITPFDEHDPEDTGLRTVSPRTGTSTAAPAAPVALLSVPGTSPSHLLDHYRVFRQKSLSRRPCPRFVGSGAEVVNLFTGELTPKSCYRLVCPVCVVIRAQRVGRAIGMARPTHATALTLLGRNWDSARCHLQSFFRVARRSEPQLQYAYHMEVAEGATEVHAHVWLHSISGGDVWLDVAKATAGIGDFGELQGIHAPMGLPLTYGMKEVVEGDVRARRFLELNGHRLVHASRGFWRDHRGLPVGGQKSAETLASRTRYWRTRHPLVADTA